MFEIKNINIGSTVVNTINKGSDIIKDIYIGGVQVFHDTLKVITTTKTSDTTVSTWNGSSSDKNAYWITEELLTSTITRYTDRVSLNVSTLNEFPILYKDGYNLAPNKEISIKVRAALISGTGECTAVLLDMGGLPIATTPKFVVTEEINDYIITIIPTVAVSSLGITNRLGTEYSEIDVYDIQIEMDY